MFVDTAAQEQFGPYLIFERLGVGGMATVHRALERNPQDYERTVALKRLLPHLAEDASFIKAFIREARLASLLGHRNIVQIYELGRVGTEYFISMEYIDGRDVRRVLRHARNVTGPPPIAVTVGLISQLCDALDYAHTKVGEDGHPLSVVHRDISPSNLLVTSGGYLKVIDFGIAKAQSSQLRTQTGRVKGKLAYMAPESLVGGRDLDARSDIWAMGVVLHELLTARPLFASKNEYQTLLKVQSGEIAPPSGQNSSCPPELDALVARALARDPDARIASAAEMRKRLDEITKTYGLEATPRDVATWIERAFSTQASEVPPRLAPPPQANAEEEEAVQVVWGNANPDETGPIVLDDVPDVSGKHEAAKPRDMLDDMDDEPPTPPPASDTMPSIYGTTPPLPSAPSRVHIHSPRTKTQTTGPVPVARVPMPAQSRLKAVTAQPPVAMRSKSESDAQLEASATNPFTRQEATEPRPRSTTGSGEGVPSARARITASVPALPDRPIARSRTITASVPILPDAATHRPPTGENRAVKRPTLAPEARRDSGDVLDPMSRAWQQSPERPPTPSPDRARSLTGSLRSVTPAADPSASATLLDPALPPLRSQRTTGTHAAWPNAQRQTGPHQAMPTAQHTRPPTVDDDLMKTGLRARLPDSDDFAARPSRMPTVPSPDHDLELLQARLPAGDPSLRPSRFPTVVPGLPDEDDALATSIHMELPPTSPFERALPPQDEPSPADTATDAPNARVFEPDEAPSAHELFSKEPTGETDRASEPSVPVVRFSRSHVIPPMPADEPARARVATPAAPLPVTQRGVGSERKHAASEWSVGSSARRTDLPIPQRRIWPLVLAVTVLAGAGLAIGLVVVLHNHKPDAKTPAVTEPARTTATVKLVTQPAGATILLGGKTVTAGSHELAPGMHQIEISHTGYKTWLTNVQVAAGETHSLTVALTPIGATDSGEATLTITTTPPGLQVELDGETLPQMTPLRRPLKAGPHSVKLKRDGVEVWHQNLRAEPSSEYEFSPRF